MSDNMRTEGRPALSELTEQLEELISGNEFGDTLWAAVAEEVWYDKSLSKAVRDTDGLYDDEIASDRVECIDWALHNLVVQRVLHKAVSGMSPVQSPTCGGAR